MNQEASAPYTITICKGSALLGEMKALIRAYHPGESLPAFASRVLQEDLLGKTTARRVEDLVRRVFARRFLRPNDQPARHLKRLLEGTASPKLFSDLSLLYSARLDTLLRDSIVKVYWPAVAGGQLQFGKQDLLRFIRHAQEAGLMESPWSEAVQVRVVRGVLRAMVDFGLLRETGRSHFEVRRYLPEDGFLVYLAHELHFAGLTDSAVVTSCDWMLFGLGHEAVIQDLDRVSDMGRWVIQSAGTVCRITWRFASMEEVTNAIAR